MRSNYVTCCPDNSLPILSKDKYTSIELIAHTHSIKTDVQERFFQLDKLMAKISKKSKPALVEIATSINGFILQHNIPIMAMLFVKKDKATLLLDIKNILITIAQTNKFQLCLFIMESVMGCEILNAPEGAQPLKLVKDIVHMEERFVQIQDYLTTVKTRLNDSIHGHEKAKQQIERIICQWINGEQDGHCFGFEGPPGVGKTSLAKYGLSSCLTDENGTSRPFAMIQMGGDSNGSSLHGHNYTYVGSNWGSIVQILMDKKCMNPIIFIDEVDKISKTEQGREIVGILTHLLDTTQNDCFQDKYFSGIELDLSKALFILSYNDVDAIDKVLLDRIHRIKFYSLSIEEKLVICRKHILPDIYKKMGLEGVIQIEDDVMKYIIEEYTCEPGVRKLKEMLFDIVGEINKNILTNITNVVAHQIVLPMVITKEQIKKVYLKDHQEIIYKTIHTLPQVGTINGMYATGAGNGGIIPIQTSFMPGSKFLDLTLTGMQGQVMKESMNVALTLAWTLTDVSRQSELKSKYGAQNIQSIHIHCPEGATPKDGPSAGGAITCALFSLLNEKKIKNDVAMTGEISLNGDISAIGGLDVKIYGSIRAGVKTILYPKDNQKDFENFAEKYAGAEIMVGITFHSVRNIKEAIAIVMVE
jgi:endopeptidase La